MRCVDVNVLVYAHRPESERHEDYRSWLDEARRGPEPLGLWDAVLTGFLRIVTHPRVFREPTPLELGLGFLESLRAGPACLAIGPGDRHWPLFVELCRGAGATGNRVPDASLAALAIEQNATLTTADRGFARYPGLRWEHPLDR
jgi:toxin-antitoxin system PIN domain toxin